MNMAELRRNVQFSEYGWITQERRVSESGYLKTSLMEIASAVERMVLLVDPNFEKDETNDAENLIIHDVTG